MTITGQARLAGIAGWPIGHSLSPRLHAFWIGEHELDAAYVPLPVRREDFASAVALLPRLGFRGLNVTIPHKQAAFTLAAEHDEAASATGAVNTLVFDDGRIIGKNTDVRGVIGMLRDAGITTLSGQAVTVLGAGGAARAVVFALTELQAARIWISNRTHAKAEELAARFDKRRGTQIAALGNENRVQPSDIVINATSMGMTGSDGSWQAAPVALPKDGGVAVDIVYRPLETQFLASCRTAGAKTVDGLGMLMHQAVPAFAAWFGIEPKVTPALRAHLLEALKEA
jgi:shikimate dehydrogenase